MLHFYKNIYKLSLLLFGPETIGFTYLATDSDKVLSSPSENLSILFFEQELHNPAGRTTFVIMSFLSLLLHLPHRAFPHSLQVNFAVAPQFKHMNTISSFFSPMIITVI